MTDEQLRERFRALRDAEAERVPGFERTLARAEAAPTSPRGRWLWAPALAVAAAALWVVLAVPTPRSQPSPLDPGRWSMPTDVLLDLPGAELLSEVPAIGAPVDVPSPPRRTGRGPHSHRRILT